MNESVYLSGAQVSIYCGSVYAIYVLFDMCKCNFLVCFDVCDVFLVVDCSCYFRLGVACFVRKWSGMLGFFF